MALIKDVVLYTTVFQINPHSRCLDFQTFLPHPTKGLPVPHSFALSAQYQAADRPISRV
jgi:hypothetical protein